MENFDTILGASTHHPNGVVTPKLDFTHIHRLTNSVGIVQHAKYATPHYLYGYCLDDNARALMVCGMADNIYPSRYDTLIDRYLAFILHMQRDNGKFGNFLSFDHRFLDEDGTEDAFGRTIWALGSIMQNNNHPHILQLVKEILDKAFPHIQQLQSIRAMAYTLCGLILLLKSNHYPKDLFPAICELADCIATAYERSSCNDWNWYENILTYDNAIIPYSLFLTEGTLRQDKYIQHATESALFLDKVLYEGQDVLALIGNAGWYSKDGHKAQAGQQAIEIPSLILMYQQLAQRFDYIHFSRKADLTFRWFHGNNRQKAILFDKNTQGCRDGIDSSSINQNQGAESCICYWQAYLYHYHKVY